MRKGCRAIFLTVFIWTAVFGICGFAGTTKNKADSIVITFKDGHRQSFSLSDISRIEFQTTPKAVAKSVDPNNREPLPPRASFVGAWIVGVGDGHGDRTFKVLLEENGRASKSRGRQHGSWVYADGEAHISWDDGWHDAIRRVGQKYQKAAYGRGRSFGDNPSNVAEAYQISSEPI